MHLLLLLACNKDVASTDTAPNLGLDPAVPAAAGEARAGVIRDDLGGLFGGITAEGQAGDIKLYNDRVQLIIQAARPGHGYVDTGGHVIDLDLVRGDGTLGRDIVEDVFLSFGMARLFDAERVEIWAEGGAGEAAVVRATGADVPWGFFQGLLERDAPALDDLNLEIEVEYRLEPDSDTLQITTTLRNTGDAPVRVPAQDGLFVSGEDALSWATGTGFEGPQGGQLAAQTYTGRWGEASFSSWAGEGDYEVAFLSQIAAELGIFLADRPVVEVAAGERVTLVRVLAVGPDTLAVEASRREARGETLHTVEGVVQTPDGEGVVGAQVHFVDAQGEVAGFARTGAEGRFEGALPQGAWTAYALAPVDREQVERPAGAGRYGPFAAEPVNAALLQVVSGRAQATELALASGYGASAAAFNTGDGALALTMTPPAWLVVNLEDGQGQPLPGVLDLRWAEAPESPVPEALREALGVPGGSRALWGWTYSGQLTLAVEPGDYLLSAGHSWRHGRVEDEPLSLASGERTELTLTLDEWLPREGWWALDPHLHAAPSFDGNLPMLDRLVTCAATGVPLPVTTDHDALVDYSALSENLGLDSRLQVITGLEVTSLLRGHFNLFPLEPQDALNGGIVDWWQGLDDTEDLFERMRDRGGEGAFIQVNHPRAPGMFSFAEFDADEGAPGEPSRFSWDFDLMELRNEGGDNGDAVLADWFSLLDRGARAVPVGVSDSHYRYIPCGMGRTDLYLGADSLGDVTQEAALEALRAGHVVVASGTTLRAQLDGALPGDTVTGASPSLAVQVKAPPWIEPGTLRVHQGGEVVFEQVLSEAVGAVWFDDEVSLTASADTWVVVEVVGEASLGDTWRNTNAYALTNAFFWDVDGDGWEAPVR